MNSFIANTTITAINKNDYINGLANLPDKVDKLSFINSFQHRFDIQQNQNANEYFIYLNEHKSEFVVTFEKLIEYGIIAKHQTISTLETAFRTLDFKANIDYKITVSIINTLQNSINIMLTPLSFKKLLYRARIFNKQVSMYDTYNYYNTLDEIYSYYTDYLTLWTEKHIRSVTGTQKNNINIDLPYYKSNTIDLYCYETLQDCSMKNINIPANLFIYQQSERTKNKLQTSLPSISTFLTK